mmetsp:Transcript_45043/g.119004  ORF Transcript_45043/g.119004 Transcript_45043/m.119004 type:complete len:300 (-) Transcript_45043:383-1282(-)
MTSPSGSSLRRAAGTSAAAMVTCAGLVSDSGFGFAAAPTPALSPAPSAALRGGVHVYAASDLSASAAAGWFSATGTGLATAVGVAAVTGAKRRQALTARNAAIARRKRAAAAEEDDDNDDALNIVSPEFPDPSAPFNPALQAGVTPPMGFFDPAGFCKVGDQEAFRNLRSAELKHGRVAMVASLGALIQSVSWLRFPGFEDVPGGLGAVTTAPGTYGLGALVLAAGAVEFTVGAQDPEKDPGDFGDPAGLGQNTIEWKHRELNNGRMAMLSISGIIASELATGKLGLDQIQPLGNLPVE